MAEALGQELLIDLYSCDEDAISSASSCTGKCSNRI